MFDYLSAACYSVTNDELGQFTRSVGKGIEREAVYLAFEQYAQSSGQWFLPRAGGYSTIATSHSLGLAGSLRLEKLAILGALTSLMLIYGIVPTPLSPVLLHYFFHNCNFESIHAKLVAEWIPELHQTLREWLSLDHTSDITEFQGHFATYHDIQASFVLFCFQRKSNRYFQRLHAYPTVTLLHTSLWPQKCFIGLLLGPNWQLIRSFKHFSKGSTFDAKTDSILQRYDNILWCSINVVLMIY